MFQLLDALSASRLLRSVQYLHHGLVQSIVDSVCQLLCLLHPVPALSIQFFVLSLQSLVFSPQVINFYLIFLSLLFEVLLGSLSFEAQNLLVLLQ